MEPVGIELRFPSCAAPLRGLAVHGLVSLEVERLVAYLPRGWVSLTPSGGAIPVELVAVEGGKIDARWQWLEAAEAERVEHFPREFLLRRMEPGHVEIVDARAGTWIEAWGGERMVIRRSADGWESAILRVYRDLLYSRLVDCGFALIHASVVANAGRAFAFVGDKGAGKSAWLLRALSRGFSMVANDRAFVHTGTGEVIGLPIAAMIGPRSLWQLPAGLRDDISHGRILRRDHLRSVHDKIGLAPQELTSAFDVEVVAPATLEKVLLLSGGNSPGSARDLIDQNVYMPRDPTYVFGLLSTGTTPRPRPSGVVDWILGRAQWLRFDWRMFDAADTARRLAPGLEDLTAPFRTEQCLQVGAP